MLIEIDPTVDFACKLLLGNPEYPDITIHFLNAILRLPAPIVSVEIVNPIVWKEFEADKLSILDILAIDNADRRLNVEVQRTKPASPCSTIGVLLSDAVGRPDWGRRQLSETSPFDWDLHLEQRPFFAIGRVPQRISTAHSQWIGTDKLPRNTLAGVAQVRSFETIMYSDRRPARSMDVLLSTSGTVRASMSCWIDCQIPSFKRAVGVLEMISRTPDQRRHYDARLKWELDENTRIQTAFEEGEIKGREEGREEGEIKLIQTLQEILGGPVSDAAVFQGRSLEQLRAMTEELRKKIQRRT